MTPQPDINVMLNDLTAQIAALVRENAILKATLATYRKQFPTPLETQKEELQS